MDYPAIASQQLQADALVLELIISPELEAFAGHFDQFPIVPGVVQMDWVLHFFRSHLAPSLNIKGAWSVNKVAALKFQHVITPDNAVMLALTFDQDKHCLSFSIYNSQHPFSSGKLFITQDTAER